MCSSTPDTPMRFVPCPHFCVAYTKCVATLRHDRIYLFICPRESSACHVVSYTCTHCGPIFKVRYVLGPVSRKSPTLLGPKSHFEDHEALKVQSVFSTTFLFKQKSHLCNVSNLRMVLFYSYGLLKLAIRAKEVSGAFEKRAPVDQSSKKFTTMKS